MRRRVMLKIGDKAPVFTGIDDQGKEVKLKNFRGEKVILYFYPKDNTPGCTQESCDFRDVVSRLKKKDTVVLGVSPDSVASHQKFKVKFSLPFPLISDEDHKIAMAYGIWQEKSMYGKKYMGIIRSTFVIDGNGLIVQVYEKVKVKGHVDAVLNTL